MKKLRIFLISLFFVSASLLSAQNIDTLNIEAESIEAADKSLSDFLTEHFPLITDDLVSKITDKRSIEQVEKPVEAGGGVYFKVNYFVPEKYLRDTMKILWELNIPEYRSHIFLIDGNDTSYVDTWNNVVGTASDKTYTGRFQAFRIRNYPTYKDPAKGKEHLPATPPGPGNPLGLFVVHYDENSLRYFHGTNKNHLLTAEKRHLSHGCVRNDNDNIAKMKEFILKRVVKSKDLTSWIDSKKSMIYDFEEIDKFPVRIIYKTYTIDRDKKGLFVELYNDFYNYSNPGNINTKWNEEDLITLTTKENLTNEFKAKSKGELSDEKISSLVDYVIKNLKKYERYYISDLSF